MFDHISSRRLATAILLLSLSAGPTYAFYEDICPATSGRWQACETRPCKAGDENQACEAVTLLSTYVIQRNEQATGNKVGARSTVHFDATYYLAQAAGFTPRDAYTVAAFDEAVDAGQFVLRGENGDLVVDPTTCVGPAVPASCAFITPTLNGLSRNNFTSGGLFFHFMTPRGDGGVVTDGLDPPTGNAIEEPFLDHVHRWVYGAGPLCVDGLTAETKEGNYAEGQSCYRSLIRTKSLLVGTMPMVSELGFFGDVDWIAPLGEQTIVKDPTSGVDMPASALSSYVAPQNLPLAKLGIFLHSLADRVSHHICIDATRREGPRPAQVSPILLNPVTYDAYNTLENDGTLQSAVSQLVETPLLVNPDFTIRFDEGECDQLDHMQRHSWETGVDQAMLPPTDQTTRAALAKVYEELSRYAVNYGFPSAQSLSAVKEQEVVGALLNALQVSGPAQRLTALDSAAKTQGWLALPLHSGLSTEQWNAEAGPPFFATHGAVPRSDAESTTKR